MSMESDGNANSASPFLHKHAGVRNSVSAMRRRRRSVGTHAFLDHPKKIMHIPPKGFFF